MAPTGVRREPSAAGFAVVAAAALVHEALGAVAERQDQLAPGWEIGGGPVGEEVLDVLAEQVGEGGHAGMLVLGRADAGCQTRPMSNRTLQLVSFAITALGALVAGFATTLVWISIGFRSDASGVLDSDFTGTDLPEGKAVLALSAATLLALLLARRARTSARVVPAVVIVGIGLAVVLLSMWVGVRAEDRAIDDAARVLAGSTGLSVDRAAELIRTRSDLGIDVATGGVVPAIVGGGLIVLGGVTTVVWVRRSDRSPAVP